jgi:prepilin-type N-terminal cleavage/methylation domain-containing protein
MKIFAGNFISLTRKFVRAFTLVEMMAAIAVFSLVVLVTVAMQVYAARVYTLAATKLTATQEARTAMNDVRDHVRSARLVYVGNYVYSTGNPPADFNPITNGGLQIGNALMIYPTTTTNSFTLVYLQPGYRTNNFTAFAANGAPLGTNSLLMVCYTNGGLQVSNDVADFITNQIVFDAENFQGTILSSNQNNYLIHMTLNFAQWEYPIAYIGSNSFNAYDYYQLNTLMTRRDTD